MKILIAEEDNVIREVIENKSHSPHLIITPSGQDGIDVFNGTFSDIVFVPGYIPAKPKPRGTNMIPKKKKRK